MRRRLPDPQDLHQGVSGALHPGDKVRSTRLVRNDGSFPGRRIGDELIGIGEVGYIRAIGSFLQDIVVYEVDFLYRGLVVGMRAAELELIEAADP
jgi:nitrogen fixation protein NifZ